MEATHVFDHMAGNCPAMRAVFATIEKVAPTDLTVLVLGETGTGKELVARSVHRRSTRLGGPFVALNCAAIPATLLESELFGFARGAFTGADRERVGHIERADGGTLFLDEIAEMLPSAQAKLLRVVEDRSVRRLGAARERKIDVRFVAATHQDLPTLVANRSFRADLYHRLNEVCVRLPPLRERGDDIDHLTAFFLAMLGREYGRPLHCTVAAAAVLRAHAWPGNVRELENCLRRAVATSTTDSLDAVDLELGATAPTLRLQDILAHATEAALRASLRRHGGDAVAAASELDVPLSELQRLAARHGVRLASS